jgi:hypothetical protein
MPRRSLSERATTRYLRLALRRGDAAEARRYAADLVGLRLPRASRALPRSADVNDCLATFARAVGA